MVLTGPTGFVGRRVLDLLRAGGPGGREVLVRAVTRRPPADRPVTAGVEWWPADLAEPGALAGVAAGADAVVHLACRVSGSAQACERTNVTGTRALMAEVAAAGVARTVHLSTTAVYGPGPHRGEPVDGPARAPVSAASRTRLAAETIVRDGGGIVLRPGLVVGEGDRWVVPALAELRRRVPHTWDGGDGRLSLVAVDDLARLVVAAAVGPEPLAPGGVHHASHPEPVRSGDLLATLTALGVLPEVSGDLSWDGCLAMLARVPGAVSERQFALLARDHWYASEDVWRELACVPGPGPLARLAAAAPWYTAWLRTGGEPGAPDLPKRGQAAAGGG